MNLTTLLKKIKNRFQLIFLKSNSYIRYISFSCFENNGIKKIGNLSFLSNFEYNYQIIKFSKNDPTIVNLKKFVSKDSIFIDIGANIGIVSLIISSFVDKVYSFEPVISSYINLCRNIQMNSIKNIVPLNIALSEKCSLLEITNVPYGETNKVVKTHILDNEICREYDFLNVFASSLDNLNKYYLHLKKNKKIIIKIDTESHELYVLNGAKSFLMNNAPILVCMEQNPRTKRALVKFMNSLKFKKIDTYNFEGFVKDEENLYFANDNFLREKK